MKKIKADTSKLQNGMVVKNYKELCELLGLEIKTGESKAIQLASLQQYYFSFEQQGHKILIKEIYTEPVPEIPTVRKGKYSNDLTNNILVYLNGIVNGRDMLRGEKIIRNVSGNMVYYDLYVRQNELMFAMGMFNEKYPTRTVNSDFEFKFPTQRGANYSIREFYSTTNTKLREILYSSLNSLKRRYLIKWEVTFIKGYNNSAYKDVIASKSEQTCIMGIYHDTLLEFEAKTERDIFLRKQSTSFYDKVNKTIKEELGCDYVFKVLHISNFQKNNIQKEIDYRINKHEFNLLVVDGLKETIDNKIERTQEQGLRERALGINMNSFMYPNYFKDSQYAFVDYFIQLKDNTPEKLEEDSTKK